MRCLPLFLRASLLLLLCCPLCALAQYTPRTWTAGNGKTLTAVFEDFEGLRARLRSEEHGVSKIAVMSFGAEDQAWLKQVVAARKLTAGLADPEPGRARAALKELERMDEIGRVETGRAFAAWYKSRFAPLAETPPSLGKKAPDREAATTFLALQKEARANAQALDDSRKAKAKTYFDQLDTQYQAILESMVDLTQVDAALEELSTFLERVEEMAPDAHAKLLVDAKQCEEALQALRTDPRPAPLPYLASREPSFSSDAFHWRYSKAREIAAENAAAKHGFGVGELENAEWVNRYRTLLGLEPLRFDAALGRAARSHSQEMVEKEYFSHTSPTSGRRSFVDRVQLEGYAGPAGENIAAGPDSGAKVFWMWFNSVGHHQNMIGDHKDIGVGQFDNTWTQVFGRGAR